DVPFFVAGQPLAHGAGRGERLTPLEPLPSRSVVAVLPPFPVATSEAYRWLDEGRETGALPPAPDPAEAAPPTAAPSWETVEAAATNDFEAPVFARHPVLGRIRDLLEASGAGVARMAGTGSTVFGVF